MECKKCYVLRITDQEKKLINETRDGLAMIQDLIISTEAKDSELYEDITDAILALNDLLIGTQII